MNLIKLSMSKFCLLLGYFSSFFRELFKIRRGFVSCFQNLAGEKKWFCKFLDAAQLVLHVTDKFCSAFQYSTVLREWSSRVFADAIQPIQYDSLFAINSKAHSLIVANFGDLCRFFEF